MWKKVKGMFFTDGAQIGFSTISFSKNLIVAYDLDLGINNRTYLRHIC